VQENSAIRRLDHFVDCLKSQFGKPADFASPETWMRSSRPGSTQGTSVSRLQAMHRAAARLETCKIVAFETSGSFLIFILMRCPEHGFPASHVA
jgi:hypothetical protein